MLYYISGSTGTTCVMFSALYSDLQLDALKIIILKDYSVLLPLEKIQNRAKGVMGSEEGNKLQTLAHRRGISTLSFLHRLLHGVAPAALLEDGAPTKLERVGPAVRETRQTLPETAIVIPKVARTSPDYWANSCVKMGARCFNDLPEELQRLADLQTFKKAANGVTLRQPFNVTLAARR